MFRVMNKGGKIAILEPAEPSKFPFKHLYSLYFKIILPFVGKLVSKDNPHILIYQNLLLLFQADNRF